jgi:hypothetical protein
VGTVLAALAAAGREFRRLWLDRVERILAAPEVVVRVEPAAPPSAAVA